MSNIIWSPGVTLEVMERQIIEAAYRFYGQNKSATAQSLGIAIRTLDHRLEKYTEDDLEQEIRNEDLKNERLRQLNRARGIPASAQFDNAATPSVYASGNRHDARVSNSSAAAGVSEEVLAQSAPQVSAQQTVPMPERAKVQEVLSSRTAAPHTQRKR